jgi:hypothetical protein
VAGWKDGSFAGKVGSDFASILPSVKDKIRDEVHTRLSDVSSTKSTGDSCALFVTLCQLCHFRESVVNRMVQRLFIGRAGAEIAAEGGKGNHA